MSKSSIIKNKLEDAEYPGHKVSFSSIEAELLGVFEEDALSEDEALESACDKLTGHDADM